ncbi:hypothetical protein [Blastopirellula marina]|uniref:Uncharacterized protein n=1 Tax=Blastopirellula marina TaxID=124 RepID=A0A2S8GSI4_9BACT|nr:hypothetical protein [Blastopirellula marina]PQO47387.1 hypothetical protein C5Y93_04915 [Blastopirellula marina]
MKQLKRPTKAKECPHQKRFNSVLQAVAEALHLEHWEARYTQEDTQPEDRPNLLAVNRCVSEGRRLWIVFYPALYECDGEEQLRTIIHEYVHALHNPYVQVIGQMIDWSHEADRRWSEMIETKMNEHVTDHLTSAIYDLIKDRFR